MKPNGYFIISIGGPVFFSALAAVTIFAIREWLSKYSIPYLPMALLSIVVTWMLTRMIIHRLVPVRCPKCEGRAYEMDGVSCRFRCRVCGKAF